MQLSSQGLRVWVFAMPARALWNSFRGRRTANAVVAETPSLGFIFLSVPPLAKYFAAILRIESDNAYPIQFDLLL